MEHNGEINVSNILLTYQGDNPSRHLSWKWDIRNSGLGKEDVEEEKGEEDGAENAPAEPPVNTELHSQHEVEVSGDLVSAVDPVDGDHLHRDEGEDEHGASVVVHHLQHDLPSWRHVEQTNPIA